MNQVGVSLPDISVLMMSRLLPNAINVKREFLLNSFHFISFLFFSFEKKKRTVS